MRYGAWSAAGAARGAVTCGASPVLASLQGQAVAAGDGVVDLHLPACTVAAWADAARKAPTHASGGGGAGSSAAHADLVAWAEGAGSPALHIAAAHDAASLAALLRGVLVPRIFFALGVHAASDAHAASAVRSCLEAAAAHLDTLVLLHFAVARAAVSGACVAGIAVSRREPFRLLLITLPTPSPARPLLSSGHACCPGDIQAGDIAGNPRKSLRDHRMSPSPPAPSRALAVAAAGRLKSSPRGKPVALDPPPTRPGRLAAVGSAFGCASQCTASSLPSPRSCSSTGRSSRLDHCDLIELTLYGPRLWGCE